MKGAILVAAAGSILVMSGCITRQKEPPSTSLTSMIDSETSEVNRQIEDAGNYGVLEPYAVDSVTLLNPSDYAADNALLITMDSQFAGPVEDLVELVANATGYAIIADGEKSGSPIVVTVVQYRLPAIGMLREGFMQAKKRARLIVDQQAKTITIHYNRHEKSPVPNIEDREI